MSSELQILRRLLVFPILPQESQQQPSLFFRAKGHKAGQTAKSGQHLFIWVFLCNNKLSPSKAGGAAMTPQCVAGKSVTTTVTLIMLAYRKKRRILVEVGYKAACSW